AGDVLAEHVDHGVCAKIAGDAAEALDLFDHVERRRLTLDRLDPVVGGALLIVVREHGHVGAPWPRWRPHPVERRRAPRTDEERQHAHDPSSPSHGSALLRRTGVRRPTLLVCLARNAPWAAGRRT